MGRKRKPSLAESLGEKLGTSIGKGIRCLLSAGDRRSLIDKANAVIDKHSEQLAQRRAKIVRQDTYGKPMLDKWYKEIEYFITHHIEPSLTSGEQSVLDNEWSDIARTITERIEAAHGGLLPK